MHLLTNKTARGVRGFTLVELLVVITIIGMLMALLIPAVGSATDTARTNQCVNNIRQLGVGLLNYQTSKQKFPGYVQPLRRSDGMFLSISTGGGVTNSRFISTASRNESQVSWVGIILPQIDQQPVYDLMIDGGVTGGEQTRVRPIEVLRCPSDSELLANPDNAGVTYSANAGSWDWNGQVTVTAGSAASTFIQPNGGAGPGDVNFNGVFFNLTRLNRPITQTLASIRDGASNTILLSENVHKELETPNSAFCWMGVNFEQPGEQQFGVVWTASLQPNNEANVSLRQQPIGFETDAVPPYPSTTPEYARPASEHAGGSVFNAAFVDGHASTISTDIDYTVYQQLLSAQGRKIEFPGMATPATDMAITSLRTLAPLSAEDF